MSSCRDPKILQMAAEVKAILGQYYSPDEMLKGDRIKKVADNIINLWKVPKNAQNAYREAIHRAIHAWASSVHAKHLATYNRSGENYVRINRSVGKGTGWYHGTLVTEGSGGVVLRRNAKVFDVAGTRAQRLRDALAKEVSALETSMKKAAGYDPSIKKMTAEQIVRNEKIPREAREKLYNAMQELKAVQDKLKKKKKRTKEDKEALTRAKAEVNSLVKSIKRNAYLEFLRYDVKEMINDESLHHSTRAALARRMQKIEELKRKIDSINDPSHGDTIAELLSTRDINVTYGMKVFMAFHHPEDVIKVLSGYKKVVTETDTVLIPVTEKKLVIDDDGNTQEVEQVVKTKTKKIVTEREIDVSPEAALREILHEWHGMTPAETVRKSGETYPEWVERMASEAAQRIIKSSPSADAVVIGSDILILNHRALGNRRDSLVRELPDQMERLEEAVTARLAREKRGMSSSEIREAFEKELHSDVLKIQGLSEDEIELIEKSSEVTRSNKEVRQARRRARARLIEDVSSVFGDTFEFVSDIVRAKSSGSSMKEVIEKWAQKRYEEWASEKRQDATMEAARHAVALEIESYIKALPKDIFSKKGDTSEERIGGEVLKLIAQDIGVKDAFISEELAMMREAYSKFLEERTSKPNEQTEAIEKKLLATELSAETGLSVEEVMKILDSPLSYALTRDDIKFGEADAYRGVHFNYIKVDMPLRMYKATKSVVGRLEGFNLVTRPSEDGEYYETYIAADPEGPWAALDGTLISTGSTPAFSEAFAIAGFHRRVFLSAAKSGLGAAELARMGVVGKIDDATVAASAIADILLHDNFELAMLRLARMIHLDRTNMKARDLYAKLYSELSADRAIFFPEPAALTASPGPLVDALTSKLGEIAETVSSDMILTKDLIQDNLSGFTKSFEGTMYAATLDEAMSSLLDNIAPHAPAEWESEPFTLWEFMTRLNDYLSDPNPENAQALVTKFAVRDSEGNITWKDSLISALFSASRVGEKGFLQNATSYSPDELALGDIVFIVSNEGPMKLATIGHEADDLAMASSGVMLHQFLAEPIRDPEKMRKVSEVIMELVREVSNFSTGNYSALRAAGEKFQLSDAAIAILREHGALSEDDIAELTRKKEFSISDLEAMNRARVGAQAAEALRSDVNKKIDTLKQALEVVTGKLSARASEIFEQRVAELEKRGMLPEYVKRRQVEKALKSGERVDISALASEKGSKSPSEQLKELREKYYAAERELSRLDEKRMVGEKLTKAEEQKIAKLKEEVERLSDEIEETENQVDLLKIDPMEDREYRKLLSQRDAIKSMVRRMESLVSILGQNSVAFARAARKKLKVEQDEFLSGQERRIKKINADLGQMRLSADKEVAKILEGMQIGLIRNYITKAVHELSIKRTRLVDALSTVVDLAAHDEFFVKMAEKKGKLSDADKALIRMRAIQALSLINSAVEMGRVSYSDMAGQEGRQKMIDVMSSHLNGWVVSDVPGHLLSRSNKAVASGRAILKSALDVVKEKGHSVKSSYVELRSLQDPETKIVVDTAEMHNVRFIHPLVLSKEGDSTVLRARNVFSEMIERMSGAPAQPLVGPHHDDIHARAHGVVHSVITEGRLTEFLRSALQSPKSILGAAVNEAIPMIRKVAFEDAAPFTDASKSDPGLNKLRDYFKGSRTIQELILDGFVEYDYERGVAYVKVEEGDGKTSREKIVATPAQAHYMRAARERIAATVADYARAASIVSRVADTISGVTVKGEFC